MSTTYRAAQRSGQQASVVALAGAAIQEHAAIENGRKESPPWLERRAGTRPAGVVLYTANSRGGVCNCIEIQEKDVEEKLKSARNND